MNHLTTKSNSGWAWPALPVKRLLLRVYQLGSRVKTASTPREFRESLDIVEKTNDWKTTLYKYLDHQMDPNFFPILELTEPRRHMNQNRYLLL